MAHGADAKVFILVDLHLRISKKVLLSLLQFAVAESKPRDTSTENWTVDHYVNTYLGKIASTITGQKNIKLFVPGFGVKTDPSIWPLYLVTFVIVDIADERVVSTDIKDKVQQMTRHRTELYNSMWDISNIFFDNHVRELRILMEDICQYIQKTNMNSEIEREIEDIIRGNFLHDQHMINIFHENMEMEKSYRENINHFTADELNYHNRMEQVISILEQNHLDDLTRAQQSGHDLTERHLPPRGQHYPAKLINVMPIVIEIAVTGCGDWRKHSRLIKELTNIINNTDEPADYEPLFRDRNAVRTAFDQVFSRFGEFHAQSGCIQLVVSSREISKFFCLLNECVEGDLTSKLKPVQDIVRGIPGFEQFEYEVVLYRDHYTCVMDNLAGQLLKEIEAKGLTLKPTRSVKVDTFDQETVRLTVACHSLSDRHACRNAFLDERLQPTFDVLQQQLKYVYPDMSLSARLLSTEEDSCAYPKKTVVRMKPKGTSNKTNFTFSREIDLRLPSDRKTPSVTAISVNGSGRLVAADLGNTCIKLINTQSGECMSSTVSTCCIPLCNTECVKKYRPWGVSFIDEDRAVVSVPAAGKLIFVDTRNDQLSIVKELINQTQCRGLAFCRGRLYVTYGSPEKKVRILNTDDTILKTFSNEYFSEPWYVTVNGNDMSIFVSETLTKRVLHLDDNGILVHIMDLKQVIDEPRGLLIKDASRLWVCAYRFNGKDSMAEIDLDKAECSDVVGEGIEFPIGIQIDSKSSLIYVSMCKTPILRVLKYET
ncbi:uncharacterized protein LOC127880656 isoform X2 [Dreissena polymorpha]|uniref:Uncharacterized protein n=2 Tax=Dreissena polymorpha TaxID=45954 RepID=A0A9D4GLP5_DREPO|nr:uncharacterized protein LOC127880656 isoform X2 [Dreissena polymorpha]XP_052283938.1 uncharacterized protein LOC127880656 isoform X2 [Dreissena polymorpha]KAH3817739.1 hypothetical protein DPMN_119294 [Dreissena polymorpha]